MVYWREDLKIGTGYLESWVYHVVQSVINVNEGVTKENAMADLFQRTAYKNLNALRV